MHYPDIAGKTAVISGAASGIGRAAAMALSEQGASVVLLDIDADSGQALAHDLGTGGAAAMFVACDVTSSSDCQRAVDTVLSAYSRIDILCNNAGIIRRKTVVDLPEDEWDAVLAVNLKSVYLLSRLVIPVMTRQGGGSIINTGSGWAIVGGPAAAAYCAAKGGVLNLTRAMAIDHGPQGIRVNCVCPGDTDTPLLHEEARQLGLDERSFLSASANRPLRRLGTPPDIARAILYLASEASSWVTGTSLVVDGGGLAGG